MMKPKLLVIVGPTGSGKTDFGIRIAKKLKGAVVSADSRQIYAGMNIGTASPLRPAFATFRPRAQGRGEAMAGRQGYGGQAPHDTFTADIIDGVDHYLFNIHTPDKQLTLAEWQVAAFKVIDKLIVENTPPILVGGTMLYVDSVVKNFTIPEVPANNKLREKLEEREVKDLYEELIIKDPTAAKFIEPKNKRRIIRALEVIEATGESFSKMRQMRPPRYDIKMLGVFSGWEKLKQKIAMRAEEMLKQGLLEETQELQKKYGADLPLLNTLNYKEAVAVLAGKMTRKEAVEEMIRTNMRYARRQMSWWKGRDEIEWEN